ncbi:MAG: helix-turn-helix domain-containing protein [bacterium]|nr:helix-turn-helix domain-containing protein [bacterium]
MVGPDGEEHVLPAEVFEVLREVVSAMVEGKAVTVAPIHQQLTTQEVADFLRVRRPALIELLDAGEIPYEHVGRHRRVRLIDALEYRHARSERRREVLDELVSVSEAAGMYETTATPQATR